RPERPPALFPYTPLFRSILATDLTSIDDDKAHQEYPANTFGKYFPVTWCHSFDGGHQWYTSLGHNPEHYDDPVFMNHILGGIQRSEEHTSELQSRENHVC